MAELVICQGLPASGKTSWAKEWAASDRIGRARVNKDELRAMLHDGLYLGRETEDVVNLVRDRAIMSLLSAGISVVSDDTNLDERKMEKLAGLGHVLGVQVKMKSFLDVPLALCIARDERRVGKEHVGEERIRQMLQAYLKQTYAPTAVPLPSRSDPALIRVMNPDGGYDEDGTRLARAQVEEENRLADERASWPPVEMPVEMLPIKFPEPKRRSLFRRR